MTRERDRIQENANKYIVKNCPCAYGFIDAPMYCLWKDVALTYNTLCQDCTDCVIKQVIEKCKYYQNKIGRTPQYRAGYVDATREILQLFDIEEVRE